MPLPRDIAQDLRALLTVAKPGVIPQIVANEIEAIAQTADELDRSLPTPAQWQEIVEVTRQALKSKGDHVESAALSVRIIVQVSDAYREISGKGILDE